MASSEWGAGSTVALGIVVGLLSTAIQSIGLTLQRKSHMLEDSNPHVPSRRAPFRRRRWQIGMFLFLIANIVGSTIQITTLPLPLLSTLQASGLVFNSIMASLILKEQWTWRTVVGTVLVAGGAVLISLFSALPEPSHNLGQLLELLRQRGFLVWFVLSLVFVLAVLVVDFSLRHVLAVHRRESPRILLIRGMAYGMLSGILSAHALLLAKSAVELIVRSLADKNNQFRHYQSWMLVLAFLVLALTQLYYLHLGLKLVSTSVLYPFVFCIYNLVAILDGLIYFRQMDTLPPLHAGLIGVGTVILLSGVLALSWRLDDTPTDDETSDTGHYKHQMGKSEIPQTVLAPGMGFVGEPSESDGTSSAALTDEETAVEDIASERSPLLPAVGRRHGSTTSAQSHGHCRRKRASTLKDILHMWEEDEDADDILPAYGALPSRPLSAGGSRRRQSGADVLDRAEDAGDESSLPDGFARAETMPVGRKRQRRHSHQGQGSALLSDMLKREWWRSRRKDKEGEGEEDG
ncbi:hypothetical protein LTR95_005872 [Oleoguttula sp. CCFEE 5521]